MKTRPVSRSALLAAFAVLHLPAATLAQQLLLHFPLDGSPQVLGTATGPAKVYVASGGTPPRVVPGKFGQALHFDGTSSIAAPFSLDAAAYPSVTVTAWVKLDPDSTGERTVFSAGNGNVPKLALYGDRAHVVGARGSLMFGSGMPRNEWVFVAGVVDVANARLAVHQGDGRLDRAGISTANLYPPSSYRNPDDPSLPSQRYVFVGSHGFKQWPARQMAIDDVRVYAGALTGEQVQQLRVAADGGPGIRLLKQSSPAAIDPKALPGDQFDPRALPGDQFDPRALPGDQFDPKALPGDQFDPKALPGDQFDPKALPGDQFDVQAPPGK